MTAPLMGDLSTAEAADLLGVHHKTLIEWAKTGKVPAVKTPGGWYRFHRSALEEFVAASSSGSPESTS